MRISTSQIFQNGVDVMQRQQAELARAQEQMSTGRRILSPSDDPSGSVQTLQFESRIQQTQQFQRNGELAERRLRLSEVTLASVGDGLQRIRDLAIQANNASQTPETRGYIAEEMQQIRGELVDLANTRDANDEYLFSGYQSRTRPFVEGGDGIEYQGDAGQRELDISAVSRVSVGDPGDAVFGGIMDGNGDFRVIPGADNRGSGVADTGRVVDEALWNDGADFPVTVEFLNDGEQFRFVDDAGTSVDVTDSEGNTVVAGTELDFTPGQTIEFNGIQLEIKGQPAQGDTFEIEPSEEQNLFQGLDRMISALEGSSGTGTTRVNNAINRGLTELDSALQHVLDQRSTLGTRLKGIESQNALHEEHVLHMETTLSEIRDLDYAEAISRFNLQQVSLKAAQQSYTQVARLSLFDYIR